MMGKDRVLNICFSVLKKPLTERTKCLLGWVNHGREEHLTIGGVGVVTWWKELWIGLVEGWLGVHVLGEEGSRRSIRIPDGILFRHLC